MGIIDRTVFISYRRTNVSWALAIFQDLTRHGYDVFYDFVGINSGDFEQVITENIRARAHFIVLLTPSALERCNERDDWLRREIEFALDAKRNIIPILLENFDFGSPETDSCLTGKLKNLKKYSGMEVYASYFEAGMDRLRCRFLNVPLDQVKHPKIYPVSTEIQEIVDNQKLILEGKAPVKDKILSAQEWFERAYTSKSYEEKIRLYTKAIELDPGYAFAYNNRGNSCKGLKQYENAIKDLDKAIELDPENAIVYSNRGNSYYGLKQYENAIKDLDKAIELDPESVIAYNIRSISYSKLMQYEKALEDINMALKIDPEENVSYYNKACIFAVQGMVKESIVNLKKALEINPQYHCELVSSDNDFDKIRGDREFQKLLKDFCDNSK